MQIIKSLTLATLFVAGLARHEFLEQQQDIVSADEAGYSAIKQYEYDCIGCLKANDYYCDYSSSYNTGNCDTTSFYWCTTQFNQAPDLQQCVNTFGNGGTIWSWIGTVGATGGFTENNVKVSYNSNSIWLPNMVENTRTKFSLKN